MDKRNYNNILAFLEEVTLFSLHLSGIKLQEHVVEKVLDNSDTLHRIDRIEKLLSKRNSRGEYIYVFLMFKFRLLLKMVVMLLRT